MSLKDSSRSPWLLAIGSILLFNSMFPIDLLSIIIPILLNKHLFQNKCPDLEKSRPCRQNPGGSELRSFVQPKYISISYLKFQVAAVLLFSLLPHPFGNDFPLCLKSH